MAQSIVIVFYTKPDCPLCEDALSLLEVAGHHWPLDLRPINILTERTLYDLYWNRIPVLEFENGSTLEPPVTRERLTEYLRRLSQDADSSA
jgi:glutaredoxin